MKKLLFFFVLLFSIIQIQAQPVPQNDKDTLWTLWTHYSYTLNFSPDSKYLMSWGDSPTIKIFETETGNIVNTIPAMRYPIFDLESKYIYGNLNNMISKYDMDTKSIISSLDKEVTDEYGFTDLSNDGKYFVATTKKGFKIWEKSSGKIFKTKIFDSVPGLLGINFGHIKFNCETSKIIVTIVKEYYNPDYPPEPIFKGGFIEFDINTLDSIRDLGAADDWVLSPNCNYIAYKYWLKDNGVRVFKLNSIELYRIINTNGPSITGIVFSPDEKYLFISHDPGNIDVWDLENNSIVYTYKAGFGFTALGLSIDGKYLAAGRFELLYLYGAIYASNKDIENKIIDTFNSYPNPTNSNLVIEFGVLKTGNMNIELVNEIGQSTKPIKNELYIEGNYSINIDTQILISGFYFIKFSQNNNSQLFKIQIVK